MAIALDSPKKIFYGIEGNEFDGFWTNAFRWSSAIAVVNQASQADATVSCSAGCSTYSSCCILLGLQLIQDRLYGSIHGTRRYVVERSMPPSSQELSSSAL